VTLPPEGIFESCPLDLELQTCVDRLGVIAQGGFRVVVFPVEGASQGSLQSYAAAASNLGLTVMWELDDPSWWEQPSAATTMGDALPSFAAACGCYWNGQLLSYLVGWLASLPATYGYFAVDDTELPAAGSWSIAAFVDQIHAVDPAHPVMIGSNDQAQTQEYQGIADVIGAIIYPVATGSLMPAAAHQIAWDAVARTAVQTQRSATRAGDPSAFILQAFTWGDNLDDGVASGVCPGTDTPPACYGRLRYPSADEQLMLRNEVLLNARPKLILWWSFPGTYGQAGDDTTSIYPTGATASARWDGLTSAINSTGFTLHPVAARAFGPALCSVRCRDRSIAARTAVSRSAPMRPAARSAARIWSGRASNSRRGGVAGRHWSCRAHRGISTGCRWRSRSCSPCSSRRSACS
jgi:hypothetical protein